jgi:hypothetical protein
LDQAKDGGVDLRQEEVDRCIDCVNFTVEERRSDNTNG